MNKKTRSTILLVLTAAMWGCSFVAFAIGSSHLGALTYTAARFILGSISMIPVVLLFERQKLSDEEKRATLKCGLLTGVLLAVVVILLVWVLPVFNDVYIQLGSRLTGLAGGLLLLGGVLRRLLPGLAVVAALLYESVVLVQRLVGRRFGHHG